MPKNQIISASSDNEYLIHNEVLGRGSYSVVKLATHRPTQRFVAAKVVNLAAHSMEYLQEVNALTKVKHPNVVSILHFERSKDNKMATIFLEYLPFPTLFKYIQSTGASDEEFALDIFAQVVDAVAHLHSRYVTHNDLKPENLSFNHAEKIVKLFDFGLSQYVNPATPFSSNYAGSPLYMAPEVLQRERHNPFLSDVWSLGIILYELLTGDTPFANCATIDQLLDRISFDTFIPIPDHFSQGVRDLLNRALSFDANLRPTALELKVAVQMLRHPRAANFEISEKSPSIDIPRNDDGSYSTAITTTTTTTATTLTTLRTSPTRTPLVSVNETPSRTDCSLDPSSPTTNLSTTPSASTSVTSIANVIRANQSRVSPPSSPNSSPRSSPRIPSSKQNGPRSDKPPE